MPKSAANGGAFSVIEYRDEMLQNIGGSNDDNDKISRRVLLLLEGEWISGKGEFKNLRRGILEKYIKSSMTDHQLALFLLNDIIRYYRTIAVDYEFKTEELSKPWAIRNIKLIFSRKLMYASGIFSVALTADQEYGKKISILEELFDIPVLERMISICGETATDKVVRCYNSFLDEMDKAEVRAHLEGLPNTIEARRDPVFRNLKNEGHHFTRHILTLFENTFGSVHPIRKAVIL